MGQGNEKKGSNILRQSLLQFSTLPQKSTQALQHPEARTAKPAISVPSEIWIRILEDLPTITLKSLRLVCQAWSLVATPQLFQTIYLDSFDLSWSRLRQLSKSQYACLVNNIVWTPLYLPEDCLNADIWHRTYTNLLRGLSHSRCVDMHQTYCSIYRREARKNNSRMNYLSSADTFDASAFTNCRRVVFSDKIDIEMRCTDPHLRERIQNDGVILASAASWGLTPIHNPFSRGNSEQDACLQSVQDMFLLIKCLPFATHFTTDMWIYNALSRLSHSPCSFLNIETVEIQLRHYHYTDCDLDFDDHINFRGLLTDVMRITNNSPNLHSLRVECVYTDPGIIFNEPYRRQYQKWLTDEDSQDDSGSEGEKESFETNISTSYAGSRLSHIDSKFRDLPAGFERQHLDAAEAELVLGITRLPELEQLSIRNMRLDVQSLLGWLANQSQLPNGSMVVHFSGCNILFGPHFNTFSQVLEALNVRVVTDDGQTLYYVTDWVGQSTHFYNGSFEINSEGRRSAYTVNFRPESFATDVEAIFWNEGNIPNLLSDAIVRKTSAQTRDIKRFITTFIDRPQDLADSLQKISPDILRDSSYYYCYFTTGSDNEEGEPRLITFRWLDEATYRRHERSFQNHATAPKVFALLVANAYLISDYYDSYRGHSYSDSEASLTAFISELDAMNDFERRREEALLETYENELLRLDITGF